jgi:hypothetical protein
MLCFAVGEAIGAPAGAALAQIAGDAAPFACLAGLMLGTATLVLRWRRHPQVGAALAARHAAPSGSDADNEGVHLDQTPTAIDGATSDHIPIRAPG